MKNLPTIKIEDETYYLDERLNQMRCVNNPHVWESMEDMSSEWWINLYNR